MLNRRSRRVLLTVTAVLALALLVAACGPAAPPIASSPQADDIVARTNYLRTNGGIGAMTVDGTMQANAQFEAQRVASRVTNCSQLSASDHSPELAAWYPGSSAAENLACVPGCPPDGAQVIDMWWNSASHRTNMMNGAYAFTGTAANCNGSVMIAVGQYRSG